VFQVFLLDCGGRLSFVLLQNGESEERKMADDLTSMWQDFKLTEGESVDIIIQK
jgi:hypothetical protein